MKKLAAISWVLNLALVAAIGYRLVHTAPSASSALKTKRPSEITLLKTKINTIQQTVVVTNKGPKFTWRDVESDDYKTYIANLRAMNCPEETVRDIIIADVNKFFMRKVAGSRKKKDNDFQFWKTGNGWWGEEGPEFYKAQRQAEREKRELLKELLGIDYQKEMAKQYGWSNPEQDPVMESIPQEKKDRIQEINGKYHDLDQEVRRMAKGYQHDEDTENELKEIEKKRRAELAKVLTPQELEEVEVRTSDLSQNLRGELEGFDSNEQEFRAIFKAKQAGEESGGSGRQGKEVQDQLRLALGEQRYKEYTLAQDWEYKNLARIAERQGLGKETAMKVYDMKKDAEDLANKIRSDQTLPQQQKTDRLKAIRSETEKAVTETLGEKGFKSYKRNAWWIRNISPSN